PVDRAPGRHEKRLAVREERDLVRVNGLPWKREIPEKGTRRRVEQQDLLGSGCRCDPLSVRREGDALQAPLSREDAEDRARGRVPEGDRSGEVRGGDEF